MNLSSTIRKRSVKSYDPDIAYLLSLISTWCYADQGVLKTVLERASMGFLDPGIQPYTVTNPALPVDANAFLIRLDKGFHVLAFRGTEPTHLVDVLTDALVEKHIWNVDEDEWVHRGFFLSLDVLWPEIFAGLSELEGDLYVTGHSLGGAMAVLAGRRILDNRSQLASAKLRGVYTYGQPMVGNRKFAEQSKKLNLRRHVYGKDLVAYLPPIGVGAGDYVHFGNLYKAEDGEEEVWTHMEGESNKPKSCLISEILPAFLTPITERLSFQSYPLLAMSYTLRTFGLAFSLSSLRDMLKVPAVMLRKLSFEDHIPTHYVDISRASRDEDGHSESASKRRPVRSAEAA